MEVRTMETEEIPIDSSDTVANVSLKYQFRVDRY